MSTSLKSRVPLASISNNKASSNANVKKNNTSSNNNSNNASSNNRWMVYCTECDDLIPSENVPQYWTPNICLYCVSCRRLRT